MVAKRVGAGAQVAASEEWSKPMTDAEFEEWLSFKDNEIDPGRVVPCRCGSVSQMCERLDKPADLC